MEEPTTREDCLQGIVEQDRANKRRLIRLGRSAFIEDISTFANENDIMERADGVIMLLNFIAQNLGKGWEENDV